jgi:hypothetical protein
MALRAASSLMSYTGLNTAAADWILECGPCEASLSGHELWGPAGEPAPLTVDEIRLREAQHADATRNLWAGLAQMPEQLAALAIQNQGTMAILAKLLGVDTSNGLPQIPVGALTAGGVIASPVQDAVPPAPPAEATLTAQQKAAATRAANKAAAAGPDAG